MNRGLFSPSALQEDPARKKRGQAHHLELRTHQRVTKRQGQRRRQLLPAGYALAHLTPLYNLSELPLLPTRNI